MAAAARTASEKYINHAVMKRMVISGAISLDINRAQIDALNVFPVPDGDTGTNMSLTMKSVVNELNNLTTASMDELAQAVSQGALKGARGNSGVILSQILKGFSSVIATSNDIDIKIFANAMKRGTELAYSAVSKPKEGTMLTVIRVMSESALEFSHRPLTIQDFLENLIKSGEEILAQTPEMLDVLKKAGVVDSGGFGLVLFFKGLLSGYLEQEISGAEDYNFSVSTTTIAPDTDDDHVFIDYDSLDDIEFGYCTEFFIINLHKKTTLTDIDKLRDTFNNMGDSVLVIGDLNLVKVHVHTNNPGVALAHALELGEIDKIKIENMLEQNRELRKKMEAERKPVGLLAVCAGDGFSSIFKDLMVDQIIEGGQTMNPSANDISSAIKHINAESVIVLPNNKNIILAAEQARALVPSKNVLVVPTTDIPQGLAAVLSYNPEVSAQDNVHNMNDVIQSITSGSVTFAVRNSEVNGLKINKGDIIGIDSHDIVTKGSNVDKVTIELIKKMKKPEHEIISLYYGCDVTEEEANEFSALAQEAFPDCEVTLLYGGQPLYYYIISIE